MSESPRPALRPHPAALLSFLLGLASVPLFFLGPFALLLGIRGLRAANASNGRLRGARLALAGILLGGLATVTATLGLLAVVIVHWQNASRRLACTNHLRLVGLALKRYEETHETFPPATRVPEELAPDKRLSWFADVLPLLHADSPEPKNPGEKYVQLAAAADRSAAWNSPANADALNTPVREFLCPGHPDYRPRRQPGLTHYVGVAGLGSGAAFLDREDARAGVFGHGRGVKLKEMTGGVSYTMAVLETAWENGPWLAGGFPTVRGLDLDVEHYSGPGRPFGGMHHQSVNVLWADGSVRPLSDGTPAEVFRSAALLRRE